MTPKIVRILEQPIPIASAIRNAYIDFSQMNVSVVAIVSNIVRDGDALVGFGFNSNGRYAQSGLLRERFIPRLASAPPEALLDDDGKNLSPHRAWNVMMKNEKPGGHGDRSVAVGILDMALWDLVAKIEGKPLPELIAERYRPGMAPARRVCVYAAGGYYYPDKNLRELQDEILRYTDAGYTTVKIKVGGVTLDEDLRRIEAVLAVLPADSSLAVDANGRFDRHRALEFGQAIEPYHLRWYEEPADPLDYEIQAELAAAYPEPLATGENLFSHQDTRNLVRYGRIRPDMDVLQMDPALSYGLVEYLRMVDVVESSGISRRQCVPHGGHQFALAIAAGLGLGGNEAYPGVFQPFGGFPDTVTVDDGMVALPDVPGIGFEAKTDLFRVMRQLLN